MTRALILLLLLLLYPHPLSDLPGPGKMSTAQTFIATAYIATGNPTRSGRMPQVGRTVAVDKSIIPLGSIIVVDGHRYVAEDTGGAIQGNRLDLFVASRGEAISFGRQQVKVVVENEGR
jgi:3D (Asp-Asp-Asp) domain-containing protein